MTKLSYGGYRFPPEIIDIFLIAASTAITFAVLFSLGSAMLFAPQGSTCVKRLAFSESVPNEPTDFASAHRGESRAFRVLDPMASRGYGLQKI
jgi:hypothetical protein